MLTQILIATIGGLSLPSYFWHKTHKSKKQLELTYNIKIAQAMGHAASIRDHITGEHNLRVTYMSYLIGEFFKMNNKELQSLMKGAFLHDIGKIGIPDKILLKNGKLSDEEFDIMKKHPLFGKELLEDMEWFNDAIDVVLYHHERWDGTGYPYGLKGLNIPLNARIFAIIDVFDALMTNRPYKKALNYDEAINIIKSGNAKHFDPNLLDIFLKLSDHFYEVIKQYTFKELKEKLLEKRKKVFGI